MLGTKGVNPETNRKNAVVAQTMRRQRSFFQAADVDGNERLTFAEFIDALPSHLRDSKPLAELQEWFATIDTDDSGAISLNEWFEWSMAAASNISGAGVIDIFQSFDHDRSGRLDRAEFRRACESVGFGEHADHLFRELPLNADQTVNYLKTIERITAGLSCSSTMKSFLASMAWTDGTESSSGGGGWSLAADSPEELRSELGKLLRWHGVRIDELFETIDASSDRNVSEDEFVDGLQRVLNVRSARSCAVPGQLPRPRATATGAHSQPR